MKTPANHPGLLTDHGIKRVLQANHHDPFEVLGMHRIKSSGNDQQVRIAAFVPQCQRLFLAGDQDAQTSISEEMQRLSDTDLFIWEGPEKSLPSPYVFRATLDHGEKVFHDPYSFPPQIGDLDLHLFNEGRHKGLWRVLGANIHETDGISGVLFAVWAPNAERVSVIGDFNNWDGRCHPMRNRGSSGLWELFIPELPAGSIYKFELRTRSGDVLIKTDPLGQAFELRPALGAYTPGRSSHVWNDKEWLQQREENHWLQHPMSIYEVHMGSWQRDDQGQFRDYRSLAIDLVAYALEMGFTHLELLPITEHPLDASWGYQTTGYFAPTSRFGTPDDFRWFVNHAHENGIGVLLDWAPGHFPKDETALARFDGTPLYEHPDPRKGEHRDWGTYIFNYGRPEVRGFLISSALHWLEEYHIDGLRVDAVASMLYLDYSRDEGDWEPNAHGGNENLEAIEFLKHLNEEVHSEHPGAVVIAEESTSWPQVTRPTWQGGLGFSMKWNMGWMHDTLGYLQQEPIYRRYTHDHLTFGLLYAFTENFVLPFSHDEVVHGKGSMLARMPGDEWQQFANLRLLYTYHWTYPGKKLLFMGSEFAQGAEWNDESQLDWHQLNNPMHQGVQHLVRDLNKLYTSTRSLHAHDFDSEGFSWIDCQDSEQSVISYQRRDGDDCTLIILNFTPVPRHDYRIGVPQAGHWKEVLNSDSSYYQGSNLGNAGDQLTEPVAWMGHANSLQLTLPPLGALVLQPI